MRYLLPFFAAFLITCQPVPKDIDLQKYRNQHLEGYVYIDPSLKDKLPRGDRFLIISVRDLENPMPLAVLRVKNPTLPYKFRITGKHKLSHERVMEGSVIITARVSSSEEANPQKGDLIGSVNSQVGRWDVKIIINTEVQ